MLDTINIGACVFLCVGVFACSRIRFAIPEIRCFSVADSNTIFIEVASCKYCQLQYMNSTITCNSSILLYDGILTCSGICVATPSVWQIITTNYNSLGSSDCLWHDSQLKCCHAIAAKDVR